MTTASALARSWFCAVMLVCVVTVCASSAQALGAYKLETTSWSSSASHTQSHTFSIAATNESITIHRFWWMSGTDTTSHQEVWWKPGSVLVASPSTTGWTKIGATATWTTVRSSTVNAEVPLDLNFTIPKGTEVSFLISSPTMTHFASTSTILTVADTRITIDRRGYSGSYNATYGGTQTTQRQFTGGVSYDLAGADITWVGGLSSDWNTAGNWSTASVPTSADNATIPDAASTANDPVIPASNAVRDVIIANGGVLVGGSGTLKVGGKWDNKGSFLAQSSRLEFDGSSNQIIDDPTNNFNNVVIRNGRATFVKPILATHTNSYTIESTGEMGFSASLVTLTGINLSNSGKLVFGAAGTSQSVITKTNQALRDVTVDPTASAYSVTFLGTQNFEDLLLTGLGAINFSSNIVVTSSFTTTMKGVLTAPSITGSGTFNFNQTPTLTTAFSVGNSAINYGGTGTTTFNGSHTGAFKHTGTGSVTLNGSLMNANCDLSGTGSLTIMNNMSGGNATIASSGSLTVRGTFASGNMTVSGTGTLATWGTITANAASITGGGRISGDSAASFSSMALTGTGNYDFDGDVTLSNGLILKPSGGIGALFVGGKLNVTGNLEVSPPATVGNNTIYVAGDATVSGNGSFLQSNARFDSGLTINNVTIEAQAILDINSVATTTIGNLSLKNNGKIDTVSGLTVNGTISTLNDSILAIGGDLTVRNHVTLGSTQNAAVGGVFSVDGSMMAGTLNLTLTSDINAARAIFTASNGVALTGTIKTTSVSSIDQGVVVSAGTQLLMANSSRLLLGNAGYAQIDGNLKTTAGNAASPARIAGASATPANFVSVRFSGTSELDLNGIIFERVGNPNQGYAVIIDNGAKVTKFDFVRIPESRAGYAAIDLNTSDVVANISDLLIGGVSPKNISATDVFGITITFTQGTLGGGALYGANFEEDPNLLLFWDASPVVVITGGTSVTLAYTGRLYSHPISVHGGNAPYIYSLSNNPSWLSINVITGELFGTPQESDIGSFSFEVFVTDSTPGIPAVFKSFTMDVEFPPYFPVEFLTPIQLPEARADEPYGVTIVVQDGRAPLTFALVGAQSWLSINSETGDISGTAPLLFAGPVSFTVRVTDTKVGQPPANKVYHLLVQPSGYLPIVIESPGQLPQTIEGQPYFQDIQIRDGVAPYTYVLSNAPSWLTINSATGALSGTAPLGVTGSVSFSVTVTDERAGSPAAIKAFQLEVIPIPYTAVTISTAALLPIAGQGIEYQAQITAIDGLAPYTFSLENAPFWINIDAATGELSGTPPGSFSGYVNFRVIVKDAKPGQPAVAKDFALEVTRIGDDPILVNTPPVLYNGTVGSSYYIVLAASGGVDTNYFWFMRPGHSLPAGLVLDGVAGIISGRPDAGTAGSHLFDVGARDGLGNETFQTFSLTIEEAANTGSGLVSDGSGKYDLPERAAAGGCAIASGSSLWMLALMLVLGGLVTLRASRRKLA